MIFVAGIGTFAIAFTALYCSSVAKETWFKIVVSTIVSLSLAALVSANLYW